MILSDLQYHSPQEAFLWLFTRCTDKRKYCVVELFIYWLWCGDDDDEYYDLTIYCDDGWLIQWKPRQWRPPDAICRWYYVIFSTYPIFFTPWRFVHRIQYSTLRFYFSVFPMLFHLIYYHLDFRLHGTVNRDRACILYDIWSSK